MELVENYHVRLVAPDELVVSKYTRKWTKNQGLVGSFPQFFIAHYQPDALMRMVLLFEEMEASSCGMRDDQGQGEQQAEQAT